MRDRNSLKGATWACSLDQGFTRQVSLWAEAKALHACPDGNNAPHDCLGITPQLCRNNVAAALASLREARGVAEPMSAMAQASPCASQVLCRMCSEPSGLLAMVSQFHAAVNHALRKLQGDLLRFPF